MCRDRGAAAELRGQRALHSVVAPDVSTARLHGVLSEPQAGPAVDRRPGHRRGGDVTDRRAAAGTTSRIPLDIGAKLGLDQASASFAAQIQTSVCRRV